jgi:hypothetical protein
MLANTLTQVWSCKICTLLSSRFGSLWLLYTVYIVCWLNSPKTHTLKICLCKFSGFLLYFILDHQTSTKIEVSVYFRNPLRNSSILKPLKIFRAKCYFCHHSWQRKCKSFMTIGIELYTTTGWFYDFHCKRTSLQEKTVVQR